MFKGRIKHPARSRHQKVNVKVIVILTSFLVLFFSLILIHERLTVKKTYVITAASVRLPSGKPIAKIVIHITEEDLINCVPLNLPLVNPRVEINKGKRRLFLYSEEELVRMYKVALGFNPDTDKKRQGDGCTPEGEFYICQKNSQSEYYLSLGISYPNKEDATRGLREGIITQRQYEKIMLALRFYEVPPWNTPLGGAIAIHGCGSKGDWTLGCIALDNDNIEELYAIVPLGTPVLIYGDMPSARPRLSKGEGDSSLALDKRHSRDGRTRARTTN